MALVDAARLRIGQILLQAGLATREALREAWEQKVLFGDRLGTNLLAKGAITEQQLVWALSEQHGVPGAYGAVLDVQAPAVRRLPKSYAVEHLVVPHHFDRGVLYLLMRDPDDDDTRLEVQRMTSLEVIPVVVCEARMWSLLAQHYGTNPSLRPIPLEDAEVWLARHAATERSPSGPEPPPASTSELIDERAFEALYMKRTTDELRASDVQAALQQELAQREAAAAAAAAAHDDAHDLSASVLFEPTDELLLDNPVESGEREQPAPPDGWVTRGTRGLLESLPDRRKQPRDVEAHDPLPVLPVAARRASAVVDMSPLDFASATTLLRGVTDRDEIATIVLRAALARFERAAIFTVFPTLIAGWKAAGNGWDDALIRGYRVPRDRETVFALVADTRSHYLGPLQRFVAHGDFVKRTGRKLPPSVAVFPLLVRGRVVNILYGDAITRSLSPDVGELLILAQRITQSYEALLTHGRERGAGDTP